MEQIRLSGSTESVDFDIDQPVVSKTKSMAQAVAPKKAGPDPATFMDTFGSPNIKKGYDIRGKVKGDSAGIGPGGEERNWVLMLPGGTTPYITETQAREHYDEGLGDAILLPPNSEYAGKGDWYNKPPRGKKFKTARPAIPRMGPGKGMVTADPMDGPISATLPITAQRPNIMQTSAIQKRVEDMFMPVDQPIIAPTNVSNTKTENITNTSTSIVNPDPIVSIVNRAA